MCAIAGWISFNDDLGEKAGIVKKMGDSLCHRGPDAAGEFYDRGCRLSHRRLCVIDPENGSQPMTEGRYTIIYNGELYNTAELQAELLRSGFGFRTKSDTEVLLKAFIAWGKGCLQKLNGIYAFAVWDSAEKKLFCARDRAGVKPFFYHSEKGEFVFASEIKALFENPLVKPETDEEGILSLMLLGPARKGGLGVFRGIEELRPGECAYFGAEGLKKELYWRLEAKEHTESPDETAEHLGFLIKDSIERQLVSDVPLCTFLSGGLDSSLISAVAAEKYAREGKTLATWSIDYKDNRKNFVPSGFQPDEDAPWVDVMSGYLKTDHTNVVIDSPQLFEALGPAMAARDLPGMADIDSSLWLFCRQVKKKFTVALSGECADEIFGGYPWYHKPELLFSEGFPWARSSAARAGLLREDIRKRISPEGYVNEAANACVAGMSVLEGESAEERARRRMFLLNFYWFMQTLLDRKDRCSMAHGLEVRVPFCDHRIAEYAYNIPWELKAFGGREKGLVRRISEKYLPRKVAWRKKSPYPKTHNPTYSKLVYESFVTLMGEKDARLPELLDKKALGELIGTRGAAFRENWYGQLMCTPQMFAYLLQLELWLRKYEPAFV